MSSIADEAARAAAGAGAPVPPQAYSQLGHITRQLHDALVQLGVMPALERAALDLPVLQRRSQRPKHRLYQSIDERGEFQ